jgi:hypothetical protein
MRGSREAVGIKKLKRLLTVQQMNVILPHRHDYEKGFYQTGNNEAGLSVGP